MCTQSSKGKTQEAHKKWSKSGRRLSENNSKIFLFIVQVAFLMEVDPHPLGSKKIVFQSCDSVDELILFIQFAI